MSLVKYYVLLKNFYMICKCQVQNLLNGLDPI